MRIAATRLISLHKNKGKTIAQTISARTGYIGNPEKTKRGALVTGYECDPAFVDKEFLILKKMYASITGRDQGDSDVIAYHIRQSFKPGEITPEESNRIGYELAMAFTKGNHQFVVATHVDKAHTHNHIIFNSTALDCIRKFKDFLGSAKSVRLISDRICIENGLSVIENPKPSKGHYGKWLGNKKIVSQREILRRTIDDVLSKNPKDIAAFIRGMKEAGYTVKEGKYLSFCARGKKKFIRLRSLGDDYTDEAVRERIEGKRICVPKPEYPPTEAEENPAEQETKNVNLLIDVQNSIKAKNSPGYERWAKLFNLKQAAQTLIFLQENNLTDYDKLSDEVAESAKHFNNVMKELKQKEKRLAEISALQKHISIYNRTRDVYVKYRQAGYSKKFLSEHEGDIILHKAAKKAFDELGLKKLPTMKDLQTEYAVLSAEKKTLYVSYNRAKEKMRATANAKANTDRLLNYSAPARKKENERPRQ